MPGQQEEQSRKVSLVAVAKAVLSAFMGVRRRAEHDKEAVQLTLVQVAVAGVIGAALFVAGLILLVRFIIGGATG